MSQENEEWRPVPGWEDSYSVSSLGRVKRTKPNHMMKAGERILKPTKDTTGYLVLNLCGHGRQFRHHVHRLVAWAFIGPQAKGICVNHRNGVKTDNRPENLEYVTHRENIRHAAEIGLMPKGDRHRSQTRPELVLRGTAIHNAKLTEEIVRDIRSAPRSPSQIREIAARLGVTRSAVDNAYHHKSWKHLP